MEAFTERTKAVETLLSKAKEIAKGKTLAEAGIDTSWMVAHGMIARRTRDDKDFGLTRYPYEQGPSVSAFAGGFFEHREWTLRTGLERHSSMRAVAEHEANYINAAGYWMAFHESAIALCEEHLTKKEFDAALEFEVWALVAIRYGLRVVGLRAEFYKMAGRDPVHTKLVLPTLEQRNSSAASDDLVEPLEKLDAMMATQLMKAVASLSASNATKRAGKGGAAGEK